MMAGALNPSQFERTIRTKALRLAATANGCTIAARAASKTPATARACPAAPWACDAALRKLAYGAAAAAMAPDAGPCHAWPAKFEVTEENDEAAAPSSEANPSQAVAAASSGVEPAPDNISAELTSGGNTKKLMIVDLPIASPGRRARRSDPKWHRSPRRPASPNVMMPIRILGFRRKIISSLREGQADPDSAIGQTDVGAQ